MKFLVHHKGFVLAWSFWFGMALLLMVVTSAVAVFTKRPAPPAGPQPTIYDTVSSVATGIGKQRQWELNRQQEEQRRSQPASLTASARADLLKHLDMTVKEIPGVIHEEQ